MRVLPLPLGVLAPDVGDGGVGDIAATLFRKSRAYGGSGCSVITERWRTGERNCAFVADVGAAAAAALAADVAAGVAVVGDDNETFSDSSEPLELSGLVRQEESLEKLLGCCCCAKETAAV